MTTTKTEHITACQKCGECCKRYIISTLPYEVKKQAHALKISEKEFVKVYTELMVQLVPTPATEHKLAIKTSDLPKEFVDILHEHGIDSTHVMILPMLSFKKKEYCVFFDQEKMGCSIHPVKPLQCNIFPFVGMGVTDYAAAYDFCEQAKNTSPTNYTFAQVALQGKHMKDYFDAIAEKGLESVWTVPLPEKGIFLIKGKSMGTITLPVINQWLELARNKNAKTDKTDKKAGKKK